MSDLYPTRGIKAEIDTLKSLGGFLSKKRLAEVLEEIVDHQTLLEKKITQLSLENKELLKVFLGDTIGDGGHQAIIFIGGTNNERGKKHD